MTREAYAEMKQVIRLSNDGDAWGTAMMAAFDVCDELERRGSHIPEEWRYRPGACGPPSIDESTLFSIIDPTGIDDDTLRAIGHLAVRWASRCEARGESY
jgi:hypothetical protein